MKIIGNVWKGLVKTKLWVVVVQKVMEGQTMREGACSSRRQWKWCRRRNIYIVYL